MDQMLIGATIASPAVGVIAIIVALFISRSASKRADKQIKEIHHMQEVFIATQTPVMIESKRQYEEQIAELDEKIKVAESNQTVIDPTAPRWKQIKAVMGIDTRDTELESLKLERSELEEKLNLINSYFEKVTKNYK